MHHTSWLSKADSALFEQFVSEAGRALRPQFDEALPDGVGDAEGGMEGGAGLVGYALHRPSRFAAFQWMQGAVPEQQGAERAPDWIRWELFFVAPASSAPRIGLRALHRSGQAPALPAWLSAYLPHTSHAPAGAAWPGFLELVAMLSAHGNVATTSAAASETLVEQHHELAYLRQLCDDLSDELRQTNNKLRDVLAARSSPATYEEAPAAEPEAEPVRDLSGLRAWALANEERIVVLPRALAGAKKSLYTAPETVYGALELLAGPYRELRTGRLSHEAFLQALAEAEMQFEGSVAPNVAGEQGDAYFVTWRGRRRFLDLHLRKGGGRDERYCLRIYFFWDEQAQKVIVGWLPSHLSNSLS
jgi:hypothetical protein